MAEKPDPTAMLNLSARVLGAAQFSGTGRLEVSGGALGTPQAAGTGRLELSAGDTARAIEGAMVLVAGHATITAEGVVSAPGPLAQASTYLDSLPVSSLLLIYAWLQASVLAAVQDPDRFLSSVIVTLPFLALVVRAINRRR
jgi:hypothetical protein